MHRKPKNTPSRNTRTNQKITARTRTERQSEREPPKIPKRADLRTPKQEDPNPTSGHLKKGVQRSVQRFKRYDSGGSLNISN